MTSRSVLIRVPASVGNFGGAAGCAALALDAALNVRASMRGDGRVGVRYFGETGERVPRDESNLAVKAMRAALESKSVSFAGVELEMYGSVPVGVGLGSSTAAVWAGLLAADRLYRLGLGEKELLVLADGLDDRSDNLRAAWMGGFVAGFEESASQVYRSTVVPDDLALTVVIPEATAAQMHSAGGPSTKLDETVARLAEKMVPGLEEAMQVEAPGLRTAFVCGSGPAIGILAPNEAAERVARSIAECLAAHGVASTHVTFRPTNSGARDWNAGGTEIRLAPMVGLDMTEHRPLPV